MKSLLLASVVILLLAVPTLTSAANRPIVAVLYFDNNSGDTELDPISKGFADMVITDMSDSEQVTVVEREKLQSLLDEAKLSRSRFFDKKTAVKIGKGLGASHVVSGSFTVVNGRMRIDVRFIEIKTGKVVLTTKVSGGSSEIFELEQRLVADFLRKLNLKFSPIALPPTKVPNLKALLAYSKGLALIDAGDDAKAALMLKSAVSLAPAFGLARARQHAILSRLEASKTQRESVLDTSTTALLTRAHQFVDGHKLATLTEDEARAYLGYRGILGAEIAMALHAASAGRTPSARAMPRKQGKLTRALMKAYYENMRLRISELQTLRANFPSISARLPRDEDAIAQQLKFDYADGAPATTLLRFVLEGRVDDSSPIGSYHISPAPADVDSKLKKAALALAGQLLQQKIDTAHDSYMAAQVHEIIAEYLVDRDKVEEGIAEYQKFLDRFPTHSRWDYYEKRIQELLGLKHNFEVDRRQRYAKGLKQCIAWDMHVGMSNVMHQRVRYLGLAAYDAMARELEKGCKKSPDYDKMQKSLFQSAFLSAASFDDCELFDLYMEKWLAVGGSKSDAVGYRKNYSSCPLAAP